MTDSDSKIGHNTFYNLYIYFILCQQNAISILAEYAISTSVDSVRHDVMAKMRQKLSRAHQHKYSKK
jgi:putative effector of murein hydrolase LrgA (UPF0299 family)